MTTRLMVGWQGLRCTVKMAILLSEVDRVSMGLNHLCAHAGGGERHSRLQVEGV